MVEENGRETMARPQVMSAVEGKHGNDEAKKETTQTKLQKERFPAFFKSHTLRPHQHVLDCNKQHILQCLELNPRQVVIYDDTLNGYYVYRSRAHRKNRFMEFNPKQPDKVVVVPSKPTIFRFDWKNISWHVAVYFCLGSVCWIVNGQYALTQSDATNVVNGIGYSGLIGGLLFWIGAYLAVLEALNTNNNLNFGLAMEQLVHNHHQHQIHGDDRHGDKHLYLQRKFAKEKDTKMILHYDRIPSTGELMAKCEEEDPKSAVAWRWWGYSPSIGFWAAVLQFIGATFFAIAVISGTPGVIGGSQWQLQQALIWTGQTVGSVFFVISSWIMMVEEQNTWITPACGRIGWQSAFWNLIGSIGFLLSAIFGYLANWKGNGTVCCQLWGTAFNTYYGSWCFMIASALLYYEVESKQQSSFTDNMRLIHSWIAFRWNSLFGRTILATDPNFPMSDDKADVESGSPLQKEANVADQKIQK